MTYALKMICFEVFCFVKASIIVILVILTRKFGLKTIEKKLPKTLKKKKKKTKLKKAGADFFFRGGLEKIPWVQDTQYLCPASFFNFISGQL